MDFMAKNMMNLEIGIKRYNPSSQELSLYSRNIILGFKHLYKRFFSLLYRKNNNAGTTIREKSTTYSNRAADYVCGDAR